MDVKRTVARRVRRYLPAPVTAPRVNLISNPRFVAAGGIGSSPDGYYVHVNNTVEVSTDWSVAPGGRSLRVEGVTGSFDTHFAPEGRDGAFRTGLVPGRTYRASAVVYVPKRLTGQVAKTRLSISPGWEIAGVKHWNPDPSASADDAPGEHAITHEFTVPATATGAWIRYVSGMAAGGGVVYWDQLSLVEDARDITYFDGAMRPTDFHEFGWQGDADGSPSVRSLRSLPEIVGSAPDLPSLARKMLAELDDEVERRAVETWVRRRHGADRESSYFAGLLASAYGDADRARHEFTAALGSTAFPGAVHLELGRLAAAAGDLTRANTEFEAVTAGEQRAEALYRRAAIADKRSDLAASRRLSVEAGGADGAPPFDIDRALDTDPKAMWVRRELGIFVRDHLDEIRARAANPVRTASSIATDEHPPVFTYWHQGFSQAPAIVRRCHESMQQHTAPGRLHELDASNLGFYSGLPAQVIRDVGANYTHLSDLIRLDVLSRFGGVWLDATCLLTGDAIDSEPALTRQEFFVFNYSGPRIGTWFMASRPGAYSILMLREAMLLWWERERRLLDYFQLHYTLEMLYWFDERFAAEWDASEHRHPRAALALQAALHRPNEDGQFERLLADSWVHKLTYKHDVARAGVDSIAGAIVRGEANRVSFRARD
ncbi:capsular polysaccharide synthesis protein [Agromyces italicus]|uniref:capsular polysaccharide synthesis protein n=1 Tax=Agromyces italicus TaxID=279572 RepID=UPI0004238A2D|nr:capsular polysaccharide synthesis protein [Agromyces italicus]